MTTKKVLLYSNHPDDRRPGELAEYANLLASSDLEDIEIMVCNSPAELDEMIEEVEIIFSVHLPAECYKKAKRLRWIQSMWAGVEPLLAAGPQEDVIITKPWGAFGPFICSYVFGNLLALKINYQESLINKSQRQWRPYQIESLAGKRLGIAGLGNIAEDTARVARALEMSVYALNSDGRKHILADNTFPQAEIESFLSALDVLLITLPSTPQTKGLFDKRVLSWLPESAILINVGRGSLIDDQALIEALEKKTIAFAILDVFQQEPLPPAHPYWHLPNCLVTPHVAGPSLAPYISSCFIENYKRYIKREPLLGIVDRKRGY